MRYFSFLFLCFLSMPLLAQDPVKWSGSIDRTKIEAGSAATVTVTAHIDRSWHLYSLTQPAGGPVPTTIASETQFAMIRAGIHQSEPTVAYDESFGMNTEYFSGTVEFMVPLRFSGDAPAGKRTVMLKVRYMVCNDKLCLPPVGKTIEVPVVITAAKYRASAPAGSTKKVPELREYAGSLDSAEAIPDRIHPKEYNADPADIVAKAKSRGLWSYLWLAGSLGALSLLTPCVFPMIPITVSYFTKRQEGRRTKGVVDAFVYGLGIIFTFTALGFALALTLGASGLNQFAANPWVNIAVAGIFIVFALNLLGAFEIVIPSSVLTKLTASSNTNSVIGLLLMGLTFTITSFTCTAPFVGTVMVTAAQGEWMWPLIGMLAFSTVFALPFFLLALFPSFLVRLPKSGGWLNSVKVVMGFLEIAAALKFLSNVDLVWQLGILNREIFISIWIALALVTAFYLLGRFTLSHDTPVEHLGVVRMLWAVFFIAGAFFLFTGLIGAPLGELDAFMPPRSYSNVVKWLGELGGSDARMARDVWISDYDEGLKKAKAENKNIFIDFTGYACTNCRWMEANVFTRGDVQSEFKKFVLVRLYTDGDGPQYDKNRLFEQNRFGTIALPFYAIISPNDEEIARFPGLTRNPTEFVKFLSQGAGVKGTPASAAGF